MRIWIVTKTMILLGCIALACMQSNENKPPPEQVLEQYRQYSSFTDPGQFVHLYSGFPESLKDLCTLIKRQLIHPVDVGQFSGQIPDDRNYEDQEFPTVAKMLEALIERDRNGLVLERKPEARLVVACVHHCMLFASIMRYRGIPVRIRSGFAKYIGDDKRLRVSHVVCEVWSSEKENWILVDPDRQIVDLPRSQFEFASQAWRLLRNGDLKEERYISSHDSAARAVLHLLCHDLSYVIGEEMVYWEDPPIVADLKSSLSDIETSKLNVLDQIAEYLERPDDHLRELESLKLEHKYLQFEVTEQVKIER